MDKLANFMFCAFYHNVKKNSSVFLIREGSIRVTQESGRQGCSPEGLRLMLFTFSTQLEKLTVVYECMALFVPVGESVSVGGE